MMSFNYSSAEGVKKKKKKKVPKEEGVTKKKKKSAELEVEKPKKKKKKSAELEVEKPKKKKKKKKMPEGANALVEFAKNREHSAIDELSISKLPKGKKKRNSIVGDSIEDIQKLLEVGESDNAMTLIYKKVLQTTIDLVPYVEKNIRDTEGARGIHPFVALIQTLRELMVDIQRAGDKAALGEHIIEKILQPAFFDIAVTILQGYAAIKSALKPELDDRQYEELKRAIEQTQISVGSGMNGRYEEMREQIRQSFSM